MASGVLLSAGLVHQLADAAETLNRPDQFPWAMFLCGLTFLAFLVLEESLHLIFSQAHSHSDKTHSLDLHAMMHSHDHSHTATATTTTSRPRDETPVLPEAIPLFIHQQKREISDYSGISQFSKRSLSCGRPRAGGGGEVDSHEGDSPTKLSTIFSSGQSHHSHSHHHHDDHLELHLHGSLLASAILMMALSIHSILAGVSIGIEGNRQQIASTAIAILAHKAFEGFCLGSSLITANLEDGAVWVLGLAFSCATPLGILVGQILSSEANSSMGEDSTTIAVVQAVVAGTFLYIAIMEIGAKELLACRHNEDDDPASASGKGVEQAKLFFFVFGFLAMSLLALYT